MSEFAFELEYCARLERRDEGVVARQLGAGVADPGGRIVDAVLVEPGPEFDDRVAITGETIPPAAIEADVGPGRARYWKEAFGDLVPEHARRVIERACEVGFLERERRGGRDYVRQVARYPDWIGRIVAVENKPDLGRPGDLEAQLRTDVSLALADAVVLATESHVTGAHLNRIPDAVGVHRFDREAETVEVVREPEALPVDEPGIEPLSRTPGRTDVAVASPAAKRRARRRLAERAYGKGWRTYEFPPCERCDPAAREGGPDGPEGGDGAGGPDATLPFCAWLGRVVDPETACGPDCGGFVRADSHAVDLEAERERATQWVADPEGRRRRQAGLDRFG